MLIAVDVSMAFIGLIFSDDLCMQGASIAGDLRARTEAALAAGCDVALVCNDRAAAEEALICLQQLKVKPPAQRLAAMRGRLGQQGQQDSGGDYQLAFDNLYQAGLIA